MKAFEDQVGRLVVLGYPVMLGCSPGEFSKRLDALRAHVPAEAGSLDVTRGTIGCVLVVHCASAPVDKTLPLVVRDGRTAVERLFPRKPDFFKPIPSLAMPPGNAYLLLDIDRGNNSLNLVPKDAQARIATEDRTPLTIEEGIAVLTQHPEFLQPNHCFMMLGSRGDDKRVPALWLSDKQPKLGWCWEGNPHTWLGFASCGGRSPGIALL